MRVEIGRELKGVLRLGVLRLGGMELPADGGDGLWDLISTECAELARRYSGLTAGRIPETVETRNLYRSVGIDPTKTRPSSEALLRRIIQGKSLYRVHPLVDLFNLESLRAQLSVGLYDESRIEGDTVTARLGLEGWSFEGIRRGGINVAGRLCLADSVGPFGSPTADSRRTAIEGTVRDALAIFFQPMDGDRVRMERTLESSRNMAREHLLAETRFMGVVE